MHNYLTPLAGKLFLSRRLLFVGLFASGLIAQGQAPLPPSPDQDSTLDLSHYMGPGVFSSGAGNIGERAGAPLGFRVYGSLSGVYDDYLQAAKVDSTGKLASTSSEVGVEVGFGVVGTHVTRRSKLGLDYHGAYRRYNADLLNGSDQGVQLGYTMLLSKHFILDLHEVGGTYVYGGSGPGALITSDPGTGLNLTSQILDSRVNYIRSSADITYRATARTFYTFGGHGYFQEPKGAGLSKTYGYDANARATHRVNRDVNVGGSYRFSQMYFPISDGNSHTHALEATFSTVFDRRWLFAVEAGASVVNVQNNLTIRLEPALAAIFGPTVTFRNISQSVYPSGLVSLNRNFKTSTIGIVYSRSISSGNGLYTASRQQGFDGRVTYSGFQRWTLGLYARYGSLISIGQNLGSYGGYSGGGFAAYTLGHGMNLTGDYNYNHQTISSGSFNRSGNRLQFGLQFSKGKRPVGLF